MQKLKMRVLWKLGSGACFCHAIVRLLEKSALACAGVAAQIPIVAPITLGYHPIEQ